MHAPASAAKPYYTFGYSVLDARKPYLVQPPERAPDSSLYAAEPGGAHDCGAEEWGGLPDTAATVDFRSTMFELLNRLGCLMLHR